MKTLAALALAVAAALFAARDLHHTAPVALAAPPASSAPEQARRAAAQAEVKRWLRSPGTARFVDVTAEDLGKDFHAIAGAVDSQNPRGVLERTAFRITFAGLSIIHKQVGDWSEGDLSALTAGQGWKPRGTALDR